MSNDVIALRAVGSDNPAGEGADINTRGAGAQLGMREVKRYR